MEKQELKERLKTLRKQNHLTQKQIAQHLNITSSGYSNYEQGISTPDISTLEKIAKIYDITMDELLYDKKNFNYKKNTITLIGRNGTIEEYILTDEEMEAYKSILKNRNKNETNDY